MAEVFCRLIGRIRQGSSECVGNFACCKCESWQSRCERQRKEAAYADGVPGTTNDQPGEQHG